MPLVNTTEMFKKAYELSLIHISDGTMIDKLMTYDDYLDWKKEQGN